MTDMMSTVLGINLRLPEGLGAAGAGKGQSEAGTGSDFTAVLQALQGEEGQPALTATAAVAVPQTADTTTGAATGVLAFPVIPEDIQPLAQVVLNGPQLTGTMPGVVTEVAMTMDDGSLNPKPELEAQATEESEREAKEDPDTGEATGGAGWLLVEPSPVTGLTPEDIQAQMLVQGGLIPGMGDANQEPILPQSDSPIPLEGPGTAAAAGDVFRGMGTLETQLGNAAIQGMKGSSGEPQPSQNASFEGVMANGNTATNPAAIPTKVANPGLKTGLNGYEVSRPLQLGILPLAILKGGRGEAQPNGDPVAEGAETVDFLTTGETTKSLVAADSGLKADALGALKLGQEGSALEGGQRSVGAAESGRVDLKKALWGVGSMRSVTQAAPFVAVTDVQLKFPGMVQEGAGMLKNGVGADLADSPVQGIAFDSKSAGIQPGEAETVANTVNGLDSNGVTAQPAVKLEPASEMLPKAKTGLTPDRNELFSQIVEQSKLMVHQGQSEMELSLKPEHLGKLKLKVALENQIVTASFVAESEQVKQIIETNLVSLRKTLQDNGIQVENLMVSVGQQDSGTFNPNHSQSNGQASFQVRSFTGETDKLDYDSEPAVSSRISTSRVDLIA